MRAIGLDVHRDFCEVAIAEQGRVRSAGRIETRPEVIELFARSLASTDRVVLEVTGNAWEIVRIIEPHTSHTEQHDDPRTARPSPTSDAARRGNEV